MGGGGGGPQSQKLLQRKAAIVLGLSFCLILDFEDFDNEIKDDIGDKKTATLNHECYSWLNESVVRIF